MTDEPNDKVQTMILRILSEVKRGLYTIQLVKLIYLVDYFYYCQMGRTATGLSYIWDDYGPNASGSRIIKQAALLEESGFIDIQPAPGGDNARSHRVLQPVAAKFDPLLEAIVGDVVRKYGSLSVQELVAESKSTPPFDSARPGKPLVMTRTKHAVPTVTRTDWDKHVKEKALNSGKTIGEMKEKYGFD